MQVYFNLRNSSLKQLTFKTDICFHNKKKLIIKKNNNFNSGNKSQNYFKNWSIVKKRLSIEERNKIIHLLFYILMKFYYVIAIFTSFSPKNQGKNSF